MERVLQEGEKIKYKIRSGIKEGKVVEDRGEKVVIIDANNYTRNLNRKDILFNENSTTPDFSDVYRYDIGGL
jgi:hypothetical protein